MGIDYEVTQSNSHSLYPHFNVAPHRSDVPDHGGSWIQIPSGAPVFLKSQLMLMLNIIHVFLSLLAWVVGWLHL